MADDDLTPEGQQEKERLRAEKERLEAIKKRIDAELKAARPNRYEPGDPFIDDVAERIRPLLSDLTAKKQYARTLVGQREGQATRRTNKFLRGITGADGQYALPVDWYLYADEPVAMEVPVFDEAGKQTGTKRERVALRAMRAVDWRVFTRHGREDLERRHEAESAMYDAADWCAEEQGVRTFAAWAEEIAPRPEEDAG